MKSKSIFSFDILLFISVIALMVIGILFIFSSSVNSIGTVTNSEYIKQIVWVSIGLILMIVLSNLELGFLKEFSLYIYLFFVFLLVFTLFFGKLVNGARSWLGIGDLGIQPSEFAKIAVIIFLANYLSENKKEIKSLSTFLIAFAIVAVPMGLILLQPDMGTAVVYIPIFIVMTFLAGAQVRHIVFFLLTGVFLIIFTMLPSWERYIAKEAIPILAVITDMSLIIYPIIALIVIIGLSFMGLQLTKEEYFYWIIYFAAILLLALVGSVGGRYFLKDYQIMRLIIFLDPYVDPQGAGWNIIQSITAVGSGGFFGKGFLNGTQSHYQFLPQQSTDFIFSIISEEWGFLGCIIIYALFAIVLIRSIYVLNFAKNHFYINIGAGVVGMLFFHILVNSGMAIGIMPITGIPLLFISYGGSSLLTGSLGIAFLLNIYQKRY